MTETVVVLTPWTGDGRDEPFHPQLASDYPLLAWEDLSGRAGGRSRRRFRVRVIVDRAILAMIEEDARYLVIRSG